MDASRGWFRLGLAATSVKVIVIGGTQRREKSTLRVDSPPPLLFFLFEPLYVSATVLYTDNWWNGLMHFFFLRESGGNLFIPDWIFFSPFDIYIWGVEIYSFNWIIWKFRIV